MRSPFRTTLLIVGLLVCVGFGLYQVHPWWFRQFYAPGQFRRPVIPPTPVVQFDLGESSTFLADAITADAIADPMRRCLAFPDPPDSHWSKTAVAAYCRFVSEPAIPTTDVLALIRAGKTAELDRRFADLLHDQASRVEMRDELNRLYLYEFQDDSAPMRAALDAWKRQSPDSAYAYAASGWAHIETAQVKRGYDYANKTPEANFAAMNIQLGKAHADLAKAAQINPSLTPAWIAMINVGRMEGDTGYALQAAHRGLVVEPYSFALHEALMLLAEPKWSGSEGYSSPISGKAPTLGLLSKLAPVESALFGSLVSLSESQLNAIPIDMQRVAELAHRYEDENPLLILLRNAVPAYTAGYYGCACDTPADMGAFKQVFDQAAPSEYLRGAANAAEKARRYDLSIVYGFENLRFNPRSVQQRIDLANQLGEYGLSQAALIEANRAVKQAPNDLDALDSRGFAYWTNQDYLHAIGDFDAALKSDPNDTYAISQLGVIYAYSIHDWDKAWASSERLIALEPNEPRGWMLRFVVQRDQPRLGVEETARYLVQHFGNDPNLAEKLGNAFGDMRDARRIAAGGAQADTSRH